MRKIRYSLSVIALATLFGACDSPEQRARTEPLQPAETFNWGRQPISFQPPPPDWRRDRYNQGGLLGVDFIHSGSVGERVTIAEYYKVGRRAERENHQRRYSLAEVVDDVRLKPETWTLVDSLWITGERADTVASVPAVTLDFRMNNESRAYFGREHYFMHNNYLFVAEYLGLEENLPLFDRIVATIVFPDPETE